MKKLTPLLLLFLLNWNNLSASHVWGADIGYTCQGNGNYLITYTFYRDCFGITAPMSYHAEISNSCGFPITQITLGYLSSTDVDARCSLITTCNGGSHIGIEKYIYQGIVSFPDTCSDWQISVSVSARSYYSTFIDANNFNLYVETHINNTFYCDTSTVFLNDPVIEVCANQPFCIDPGLFDTENDSIGAVFVTPRDDHNYYVPYDSMHSLLKPLDLSIPLTINSETGTFCFTPLSTDYTQYSIEVDMWRDLRYLGRVHRDVGLIVVNCIPHPPTISGMNGTTDTSITVCANDTVCFDVFTTGYNPIDSTYISWNGSLPYSHFDVHPGHNESATFCWTPLISDTSSQPYKFSAFVKDNQCPTRQGNKINFNVKVTYDQTCFIGIEDVRGQYPFEIYPQPANEYVGVRLNHNEDLILTIGDALGKIIYKRIINSENEFIIPLNNLSAGVYLISIENKERLILNSKKLIITKY